ncbi:MAG TPA: hypothetical protein VFH56_12665 [Acidimicrobiales bacterium]|nr:hypothetical protein [Acidimicrobiales bacterium]
MTTHEVVIDCNDQTDAEWIRDALVNDGYRAHYERHHLVRDPAGNMTQERERV